MQVNDLELYAAARGLAVDGDEGGLLRPALPHPAGEGGGEERRVDAIHQDGQPALAGNAVRVGQVPAEEAEMRRAPGGDVLVVVAVGYGAADDQQQDLVEPVGDPPHVARVLHHGEVVEQRGKARPPGLRLDRQCHCRLPTSGRQIDSDNRPLVTCHLGSVP
jgi:hypothetical protein